MHTDYEYLTDTKYCKEINSGQFTLRITYTEKNHHIKTIVLDNFLAHKARSAEKNVVTDNFSAYSVTTHLSQKGGL